MNRITFEIEVRPFGKERRLGSGKTAKTPPKTRAYEKMVRAYASLHFHKPLDGPVYVEVLAIFKPVKSWSKKRTKLSMGQPHTQVPDGDNIYKIVTDAMNKIAYHDDAQIAEHHVTKRWGFKDKLVITVSSIHTLLE